MGPGGSGGWLNTDEYFENAKQIGVVLPTLNTVYYKDIYEALQSEATYYNWEFSFAASDVNGGISEAAEELIGRSVELIIVFPESNDNGTLNDLERITGSAGIPIVFLLDEGEENGYSAPTVWCNLQYLGTDMAYKCSPGKVFIIGGDTDSEAAKQIEAGLLYDSQYGLYRNENTLVENVPFAGKGRTMQETIEQELDQNQDIDTFIIIDPMLAYDALLALEDAGFTGDLICYSDESTIEQMRACQKHTNLICEYFSIEDICYYCAMAAADKVEYEISSQHYKIFPYSW